MSTTETAARTVGVHLQVEVPAGDERTPDQIANALLIAFEVGADDDTVRDLRPLLRWAEEM